MKIEKELQSKFRNEQHKAFVNIHYTNLALMDQISGIFKKHDISAQQYNVLRILRGQYPEAASISLIKERMLDKNSDVSRIIDRLKDKKLVTRKECKTDRRQKDVLISKAGLDLMIEMDNYNDEFDSYFKELDEKDLKKLNKLLDKVRLGVSE